MINVIIDDKNSLYRHGLESLFREIFRGASFRPLTVGTTLDPYTVAKADIIVKYLTPGESRLCHPLFLHRKRANLLVGVYEGNKDPSRGVLPLCFRNTIFIHRADPINSISQQIKTAWFHSQRVIPLFFERNCSDCRYMQLSAQQLKIATQIYAGANIEQIARFLDINGKNVSAHKRGLMNKFNLTSDFELVNLIRILKRQNQPDQG